MMAGVSISLLTSDFDANWNRLQTIVKYNI